MWLIEHRGQDKFRGLGKYFEPPHKANHPAVALKEPWRSPAESPHSVSEDSEPQGRQETHPRAPDKQVVEPGFELGGVLAPSPALFSLY